ncbi:iron-containing alcohol dehydrogenase family protein [Haloparvum sedimenti]|uniref:iron-containing alcohol dehydrogenase family protein n=1 Tax=Haloparvum sedimenti TaxID=1678448 RepID=UPI00071E98C1|nr:iron-containing alcohol dehydrogenase family protein [Haloparvum sedimenti]
MFQPADAFEFEYLGSDVIYGRGRVAELGDRLAAAGIDRALVVCGSNVGANEAVMGPVREGLGDRLAGVFDETSSAKSIETAADAVEALHAADADAIVGVGGGSSLNVARQMSALAADGRSAEELRASAEADGTVSTPDPDGPLTPVAVVPTTLTGADLSAGGSLVVLPREASPTGQPVVASWTVPPTLVVEDPALFETTPHGPLAGSAMNGFNKGLETVYAAGGSPVTDATATHGLRHLVAGLPGLDGEDPTAVDRAVVGMILVQYESRINVIHAFGQALSRRYPVQQGVAHAVMAPHVLRFVLDNVDGRRRLLAEGLDVETAGRSDAEIADAVVAAVREVRDSLGVPTRLRDLEGVSRDDLRPIAEYVADHGVLAAAPPGLTVTVEDAEAALERAW